MRVLPNIFLASSNKALFLPLSQRVQGIWHILCLYRDMEKDKSQSTMNNKIKISSLLLAAFIISAGAFAQRVNVTTAYNEMRSEDFAEARTYIDKAIEDERTKVEEKTWRYRGMIYSGLATSEDPGMDRVDAIRESIRSFEKAMELDKKNRWQKENRQGLAVAQSTAMNMGIEAYNEEDYDLAKEFFMEGEKGAEGLGVIDTLAIYNAGLAAEQAEDHETALAQYRKAIDLGYLGPKMYVYAANVYQKMEDQDGYLQIVQEGRSAYPDDADLIVYELNYYLRNEKFAEAKENLELSLEHEPDNKQLHYAMGVVNDNLGNYDEAVASYEKAIEIDPEYFDALYNLGIAYFNKAVEMNKEANEIQDNDEYAAAKEKIMEVFRQAIPYLEEARSLNPQDRNTVAALAQTYASIGETDKYEEMKKILDGE